MIRKNLQHLSQRTGLSYKSLFKKNDLYHGPVQGELNYQKVIEGKRMGRYIDQPDKGDICDIHEPVEVTIKDGRQLKVGSSLNTRGFELRNQPTNVQDFRDDAEVQRIYYPEIEALVKKATNATKVIVFDHTVRMSSVQQLNTLGSKGAAAGSVARVHCDYTNESAPLRLSQLAKKESYTGVKLAEEEVDRLMKGRFAFINVWRNTQKHPINIKPLAVCDTNSVESKDHLLYELIYPDRIGENYSLAAGSAKDHQWYYYPQMTQDEALMFYVYDKKTEGPRFVMHSAFEHPSTPQDSPDRVSIECRAIACFEDQQPDTQRVQFFDMKHSNNAARIRLWMQLKGLHHLIDSRMITYADLQSEEFKQVNPLKKVPALTTTDGQQIYESHVIMQYLEDKYGNMGPSFMADSPEQKAFVNLLVRMHDIYIASPNCTEPNFSHTQGCMYLAPHVTPHCAQERIMDIQTRAAKLKEIWKQLNWLENQVMTPFMAGDKVTHADLTWYPTCIFMEFLLPHVFGWNNVFQDSNNFPKLTQWFNHVSEIQEFQTVRQEIWEFWTQKGKEGQFIPIQDEIKDCKEHKWVYP